MESKVIREKSGVKDVIAEDRKRRFHWSIHVASFTDPCSFKWNPRYRKRLLGRPPQRWENEIVKRFGPIWRKRTRSRTKRGSTVASYVENIRYFVNERIYWNIGTYDTQFCRETLSLLVQLPVDSLLKIRCPIFTTAWVFFSVPKSVDFFFS